MTGVVIRTFPEALELEQARSRLLLVLSLVDFALVAVVLGLATRTWMLGVALLSAALLPLACVWGLRQARRRVVRLERKGGRVFCDGAELEVARVETRVMLSLFQVPRAYELSLWGLTVEGRALEVRLGELKSLFSASQLAGTLEEFLNQPASAQPVRMR